LTALESLSVSEIPASRTTVLAGPIAPPNWGPAIKNRILLDALQEYGVDVLAINTLGWRRGPVCLAARLFARAVKTRRVLLSVSRGGRWILLPPLAILSVIFGVSTVLLPTGGVFAQELVSLPCFARRFYIWCVQRCLLVCAETGQLARSLEELGMDNVILLPNFKPDYKPSGQERSLENPLRIVYVSRVREEKGIGLLLQALDTIRDVSFSLDIFGILRNDYRATFEEHLSCRSYAHYGGVLESRELVERLSQYDIMVFPTLCESEGFPGVLVDAAIAGLPVVASAVAANAEIIRDGFNGLLALPGDVNDWANKLRLLMGDTELRTMLATNNRAISKNFTIDAVIKGTLLRELDRRGFWTGKSLSKRGCYIV